MFLFVFPSGPLDTNAILFACPETRIGAVIDPSSGSAPRILAEVRKHHFQVERILLTHSHWDHIADATELKKVLQAPLYVHRLDAPNVEDPGSDRIPLFFSIPPVKPDGFVQDGETFQIGNLKVLVIHTPGHSPGSVCYYLPDQKVLFSGDTLFAGTIGNLSLPTSNPDTMWPSLKRLSRLPRDTRVIPGHGSETTIGNETWLSRAEEFFA